MLGTTFGGNPLACAAGLAVLEVMQNEGLINKAKENGEYLIGRLKEIEGIQNVRGKGLMIGFDVPQELKDLRKNLLYKHKVFTGEAKPNVIRLLPALSISRDQIDFFLEKLEEEINTLKAERLAHNAKVEG
jgi:acetylornithine aminotransferase